MRILVASSSPEPPESQYDNRIQWLSYGMTFVGQLPNALLLALKIISETRSEPGPLFRGRLRALPTPAWCECPSYIQNRGYLRRIAISKRIGRMVGKRSPCWLLGRTKSPQCRFRFSPGGLPNRPTHTRATCRQSEP